MSQNGAKMATIWPNMLKDVCLELFWAFVLGCLGAPWLYSSFAFDLQSLCLRLVFALLLLCRCFAFVLFLLRLCFAVLIRRGGSLKL